MTSKAGPPVDPAYSAARPEFAAGASPTPAPDLSTSIPNGPNETDAAPYDVEKKGATFSEGPLEGSLSTIDGVRESAAQATNDGTLEKGLSPEVLEVFYPDGGWRAWSIVAGAWCVSFSTWGFANSFGSYYKLNQLSYKTPSDISWIGAFQLSMISFCAILVGKAFDAGYTRALLVAGMLLFTAGLFGLSYSTTYTEIFLAQGVACGVGSGIIFLPAVSCISHYFKKRRAFALGVFATGSSIGGVVYPILLNKLLNDGHTGFGWAVRASGFLTVGLLLIACFTVNSRLPPRKLGPIVDFSHFRDPAYAAYVVGTFFVMFGLYTPMFYLQTYSTAHGVEKSIAFYSLSILSGASLFGRLIPNWLADSYGPLTILAPNCLLSGVFIFLWLPMGKSEAGLIVFAILFGFLSGCFVSMQPACIASMTVQMDQIGIRTAMAFLFTSMAALTGTPIAGAIITSQGGSYVGAACWSGVMVLLGSFSLGAARQILVRRKGTQWV